MFHQSQPVPEVNTDIADKFQPDNGIPKDSDVSCPYEIGCNIYEYWKNNQDLNFSSFND